MEGDKRSAGLIVKDKDKSEVMPTKELMKLTADTVSSLCYRHLQTLMSHPDVANDPQVSHISHIL